MIRRLTLSLLVYAACATGPALPPLTCCNGQPVNRDQAEEGFRDIRPRAAFELRCPETQLELTVHRRRDPAGAVKRAIMPA